MKKIILLVVFVFSFQVYSQTPIQDFNFNGTLSNSANTITFLGNVKFVKDRAGMANNAIQVINTTLEASIINLPLSNSSRTISIWVKYNDLTTANYIWGYGSLANSQYFGLLQQHATDSKSDLNLASWGAMNDLIVTTTIDADTWYNYVVTYDGLCSKIYRNGQLLKSSVSSRKLTSARVFGIGKMGSAVSINADIDELKIYDVALSSDEIAALYNSSSLVTQKEVVAAASVKKGVQPKGTLKKTTVAKTKPTVVLSAPVETLNNTKLSEIYSTQGLKVLSGDKNEIDITSLPEGSYLLKVTNSPHSDPAKKLTAN